jgi:hypothetical protein
MQIALFILIILTLLYAVIHFGYNIIYFIPVYLILFDVISGWYTTGTYFGSLRNLSYFIFITYILIRNKQLITQNIWICIFLLYILFLIPFSSNLKESISNYLVVWNSLLSFSLGFLFIKNLNHLKALNTFSIIMMFIFLINGLFTSYFNIGESLYGGVLTLGGFVFDRLYSASVFLILLPIITPLVKSKVYRMVIFFCSAITFIFLVVSMRRTAFLVPVLGFTVYFFLARNKNRVLIFMLSFIFLLGISYPLYKDTLNKQLSARSRQLTVSLTNEYRYKETVIVLKETFSQLNTALFGKEIFNSKGNYNEGRWGRRALHTDFAVLLHGSGLLGIILYSAIYLSILVSYYKYIFIVSKKGFGIELHAVFVALFISMIFISLQGGLLASTFRTLIFLYLGGILGIFKSHQPEKAEMGMLTNEFTE